MGAPRSCLHAVLSILERGVGSHYGPTCVYETPQLADLCYKLIYTLCANHSTCTPVMRYMRTTQDFLHKHLQHIPFCLPEGGEDYFKRHCSYRSGIVRLCNHFSVFFYLVISGSIFDRAVK